MPKVAITNGIRFMVDSTGAVLLHIGKHEMHVVNELGAVVWNKLANGEDVAQIIRDISSTTNTDYATVSHDIHDFLEDLRQRGVIANA